MSTATQGPKARQVHDFVLRQVAAGVFRRGDTLPSEAELASDLGVGHYSVRQAMVELSRTGVVRRVRSRGTIVTLDQPHGTEKEKKVGFALVVPEIVSRVYPPLIKGFGDGAAAAQEQSMLLETSMDVHKQGDAILRLLQNKVAGVAIVPTPDPMPDHQLEAFRSRGTPLVFCHRRTVRLPAPLITWSMEEVGRMAAATLSDLGHRRIAFIDTIKTPTNAGYEAGLRKELSDRGISTTDRTVLYGEHFLVGSEVEYSEELVQHVLDSPERFTAVFCADDYLAERLYLAALRRGMRVPEELSILSFGPTLRSGGLCAELGAVVVDEIELGRQAAQLIDEMRAGKRPLDDNETIVLPAEVFRGETLGRPPK